jgi:hypothetical protein
MYIYLYIGTQITALMEQFVCKGYIIFSGYIHINIDTYMYI